jgi:ATP-dependent protease ClpP protease subunit
MSDFKKTMTYEDALEGFRSVTRPATLERVSHLIDEQKAAEASGAPNGAYRIVVPDNAHGGRGFDLASIMFKNRFLYLEGPVTQQAVWELQKQIHYLCSSAVLWQKGKFGVAKRDEAGRERIRRITLYIDSPGGYVDWGLELHDFIREAEDITQEPVVVIMKTQAASMGSLLMQSGTKFMRLAFPRSLMMIHGLSYGMQGKLENHMNTASGSVVRAAQLYQIYVDKMLEAHIGAGRLVDNGDGTLTNTATGSTATVDERKREILGWLKTHMENRDTFLKVSECLKHGLIDFVIFNEDEQMQYYDHVYWYLGLKEPAVDEATQNLRGHFDERGVFIGEFAWCKEPLIDKALVFIAQQAAGEGSDAAKAKRLLTQSETERAKALTAIRALQAANMAKAMEKEAGYGWILQDLIADYAKQLQKHNAADGPVLK